MYSRRVPRSLTTATVWPAANPAQLELLAKQPVMRAGLISWVRIADCMVVPVRSQS